MKYFFNERYGILIIDNFDEVSEIDNVIESKHFQYFHMDYLFKSFVENSEIIKFFKDVIKVYWNMYDRLEPIEDIFMILKKLLSILNIFTQLTIFTINSLWRRFFIK